MRYLGICDPVGSPDRHVKRARAVRSAFLLDKPFPVEPAKRVGQGPFVHWAVRIAVMPRKEPWRVRVVIRFPLCVRSNQCLEALMVGDIRIDRVLLFAPPHMHKLAVRSVGPELVGPHFRISNVRKPVLVSNSS